MYHEQALESDGAQCKRSVEQSQNWRGMYTMLHKDGSPEGPNSLRRQHGISAQVACPHQASPWTVAKA